ncbi:MAG: glycosyltransferase family 4 protein [Burkholderiaceae bacterium]
MSTRPAPVCAGASGWRRLYPRGFDAMLGVSAAVARHYEQALGLRGAGAAQPGARALAVRPAPAASAASDGFSVVVPGRLVHEKGHADFLQALAMLRAQSRRLSVTLAGHGPLRATLEQQIGQLGLADGVAITGALSHAQLLDVVEAASLVVVPSRFEGFGLTALEAMALGRPVLATTAGGLPEGDRARCLRLAGAAAKTRRCWPRPSRNQWTTPLRQRLGAAARLRAQQHFSLPAVAARLRKIYRHL